MEDRQKQKYMNIGRMIVFSAFAICVIVFLFLRFSTVLTGIRKVLSILTPFFVGLILCYLTYSLYDLIRKKTGDWLLRRTQGASERKDPSGTGNGRRQKISAEERCMKKAKTAASVVTILTVVLLIYGIIALILPNLTDSLVSLFSQAPEYIAKLQELEKNFYDWDFIFKDLLVSLYESLTGYLSTFGETTILPNMDKIASSLAASVVNAASFVYNFVIGIIVMVYLLNEKERLLAGSKRLIYALWPKKASGICDKIRRFHVTFRSFLVGKLLDSLIIGILCFLCLSVMKMPYVLLISVIVGVTNIIPFFGPFIGAIPSALILLIVSPKQCLLFIAFVFLLQQFDGNILGPKILGDRLQISSLAVLFSIIVFGGLFGVAGMVLAVPVWVFLTDLINEAAERRLQKNGYRTELEFYGIGIRPDGRAGAEAEAESDCGAGAEAGAESEPGAGAGAPAAQTAAAEEAVHAGREAGKEPAAGAEPERGKEKDTAAGKNTAGTEESEE